MEESGLVAVSRETNLQVKFPGSNYETRDRISCHTIKLCICRAAKELEQRKVQSSPCDKLTFSKSDDIGN